MDAAVRSRINNSRWAKPDESKTTMSLYVDVFGSCNLRCPSCPVGNWVGEQEAAVTKGLMSEELLASIIEKTLSECHLERIGLFNWSEPLLNPQLPDLIRRVKSYDTICQISSNLNILRDPDALMASNPEEFRISLSGFEQEIYKRGHAKGNIEVVKNNIRRLAEARDRTNATTCIEVHFHKYKDNECDELPMRKFAESLGCVFTTWWAFMLPVEKILVHLDPEQQLSDKDNQLLDRLAVKVDDAIEVLSDTELSNCFYLEEILVLDVEGNVNLCCATTGQSSNVLGSFLEQSLDDIQARRRQHPLCKPCMKNSLPTYYRSGQTPEFDALGTRERAIYSPKTIEKILQSPIEWFSRLKKRLSKAA